MSVVLAICVFVTFSVSLYLILGRELKGVAMGVFLLGHTANLSIIAMSGSPIVHHRSEGVQLKAPPIVTAEVAESGEPLQLIVDPLPQALILTAIVISFGVMGFLLTLLVVTARSTGTLEVDELAKLGRPPPPAPHDEDAEHTTPEPGPISGDPRPTHTRPLVADDPDAEDQKPAPPPPPPSASHTDQSGPASDPKRPTPPV